MHLEGHGGLNGGRAEWSDLEWWDSFKNLILVQPLMDANKREFPEKAYG